MEKQYKINLPLLIGDYIYFIDKGGVYQTKVFRVGIEVNETDTNIYYKARVDDDSFIPFTSRDIGKRVFCEKEQAKNMFHKLHERKSDKCS